MTTAVNLARRLGLWRVGMVRLLGRAPVWAPAKPEVTRMGDGSGRGGPFTQNVRLPACQGIQPVLFRAWACKGKPASTAVQAAQNTLAVHANQVSAIPAGQAIGRAIDGRPGLALHAAGRRHPCLAGTDPAGFTMWALSGGKHPLGRRNDALMGPEWASCPQKATRDTVQALHGHRVGSD